MNESTVKKQKRPGSQAAMQNQPETIKSTYRGSGKLEGKVALITGGDSGIGRAVAVHFAREGASIAFSFLNEDRDAQETLLLVEDEGQECICIPGDLTDSSKQEEIINKTLSAFGKINILVNNAATQYVVKDVVKLEEDKIRRTFETNIISMINFTSKVAKHLQSGDRIINTTSVTGYRGNPALLDYSSTKGAITSFTRALSAQLAEKNILVNAVAPGPIITPLIPATMGDQDSFGENTPLGRPGQPSEIGPAYVFLASADSTYITGQVIHINGGKVVGG
ncbi:MAG: SDR family oxidoreductase [Leeuwenhoekiella sp.]